ncbi:molybdenum cofactor sulfurase isoform X1 [Coffea arabica]|uniref:Molybdenum cofactor sulfurase n=2 Tax=Coffea arabica TaxID=13443 RepID=A0A6P6SE71_COFAR|nr:molybdenum cofactor sulfurase-like isoform X1 [Coffea arabica]
MKNSEDEQKEEFLREFGDDYGYKSAPKNIDQLRATEFKRLAGVVYLDHAGATLYSEAQLESVFKDLNSNLYANPHSQSSCSLNTSDRVGEARTQVLDYFNASSREYSVIFTSGATAALKLVGESFPWSSQSCFMYSMENHNSVLGIREYALNQGAAALAVDVEETADYRNSRGTNSAIRLFRHHELRRSERGLSKEDPTGNVYNLFAFPSECNFSGTRFNLDLVKLIKEDSHNALEGSTYSRGCWMVLIDAAKGGATEPPDLSKHKADFVVISFYKIFGYPTGLGALIVRNETAKLLKKTYFSGGTVAASVADSDFVKRRAGVEEIFEDGTISYLSIASILHGFRILNTLTMSAISRHTTSLATFVRKTLSAMKHENGTHVCTLYGANSSKVLFEGMGPIVSFNLRRPDGSWFGYREVEKLASLAGIQLRTGCFCNPGACAKYLGLSHSDLLSNFEAGHVCWDDHDVLCGKPTGAVRASFGYMSTFEDASNFVNFIKASFVSLPSRTPGVNTLRGTTISPAIEGIGRANPRLKSISIYPIKSCLGFSVSSWPLATTGLLHDREWLLRSTSGEILTQKKVPDMCHITTLIDLDLGILFVESPRCKEKLQIKLKSDFPVGKDEVNIHPQRYEVEVYHDEIDSWFSDAVGRPCTLLRCSGQQGYACSNRNRISRLCRDLETKMNFVNEAQFLLVSEESVNDLNARLRSNVQHHFDGELIQVSTSRFRPNLVVCGGEAYAEDGWRSLRIGKTEFISLGGCNRCQMINLSLQGGKVQRSNEPLATLAEYRRTKGKITFGILLRHDDSTGKHSDAWLHVGEEIRASLA